MRFGIAVFPGSNCDEDAFHAARDVLGQDAEYLWHKDADLKGADVVILPGGFAHGDYLRTGAMARFSPIMTEVRAFADRGGPVLGICNGFQILLESGLLPGAMLRNRGLKYRCEHVHLRVEQIDTPFTSAARAGQVLRIPIGHGEGNYFAPSEMLQRIEANRQVILRYADPEGRLDDAWNPNGSANAIAGLCNEARNVVGMMPHPERACEALLGSVDGRAIFDSIVGAFRSADQPSPRLRRSAMASAEAERLALQPSVVGAAGNRHPSLSMGRSASLSAGRSR
ncbi:MAG: phosphoribosylformylglycinamidine synthase I [Acidobacteria bacterium]|nr:MAG: phosphoribosylformylglycinamidine synthase I [Acidobacteriota bacterium]PYR19980.1 MAG: phosphoribosylformylglycinamidine synthase I [Acidobacteriota bacterium]PYR53549.1 MAG: phosphoribosylformylglycinamidine synthase I [Acidobacteriota bacterium]